jgi:CubicO group peptidase (beta-lactamase class C family)
LHVDTQANAAYAADLSEKLEAGVRSGLLRDLHCVLVWRAGETVLERYFEGRDEAWGRPLGRIAFGPDVLHDLRSVTKSIVGLLYGIAVADGLAPEPDARLLDCFPEYRDVEGSGPKSQILVRHALSMTLGLDWDERSPYTDASNGELAMERAPDRYRFILARALLHPPGNRWEYCGGATALLGALIARGSGRSLSDFSRERLFEPLGISRFEWAAGRDGVHSAASGLRLTARDLARIGELVLNAGRWGAGQVVPRSWLRASFQRAVPTGDGLSFGWHWFLGDSPAAPAGKPEAWIGAFGNGGQRLWIMPSASLYVVTMAGAYDRPDGGVSAGRIWREIVLASLPGDSPPR